MRKDKKELLESWTKELYPNDEIQISKNKILSDDLSSVYLPIKVSNKICLLNLDKTYERLYNRGVYCEEREKYEVQYELKRLVPMEQKYEQLFN